MQSKWIGLLVGTLLLVAALVARKTVLQNLSGHNLYYWASLVLADLLFLAYLLFSLYGDRQGKRQLPPLDPTKDSESNRRQAFRVVYPAGMRPAFLLESRGALPDQGIRFDIVDMAERGVTVDNPDRHPFPSPMRGSVSFADDEILEVSGKVIRQDGRTVTLKLDAPLPHKRMIAEQRYVLAQRRTRNNP
jgi:hypothetical protein